MSGNILEFGVLFSANNLSEFNPKKLPKKAKLVLLVMK